MRTLLILVISYCGCWAQTSIEPPHFYTASLVYGPGSAVTVRAWSSAGDLKPTEKFIGYFFNRPHDIVWVSCGKGYTAYSATNPTKGEILLAAPGSAGLSLDSTKKNEIRITCAQ